MTKKLACFTMILALLCSLTGCSSTDKQEAYDLFMQSAQSINEQTGLYMNLSGMLTTKYKGESSFMAISGYYMTQQSEEGKKLVDSILSISSTASEEPTDYNYVSDGEKYAYVMNNEMKELSEEEFKQATAFSTLVTAFDADCVKSATLEEPEEGKTHTTYTLTLDKKKTGDLATKLLESINMINTAQVPVTFDNSKVSVKIVVNEQKEPVSFGYSLETDATAEGETMTIKYNINFMIYQTGDEVKVNTTDLAATLAAQEASSSEAEGSSGGSSEQE